MSIYINRVTQAVLETDCEISGGDWELMPVEEQPEEPGKGKKRSTKKKSEG